MLVEVARTPAQVREHYVIERELADRLRAAPRAARPPLYGEVYDELFRRVPHHPQLRATKDSERQARRRRSVEQQWRMVKRFLSPGSVFMEIGAGDCTLSIRAAAVAGHVYAIDVSEEITRGLALPANVELRLTIGAAVPAPSAAVHVAFSNQLMEHLHPEDALDQLREIQRSLAPGGVYVCITPNRLNGPHDISAHFDERATGLHLREYSARELRALLREAGFREVRFYAGARGWYLRVPYAPLALAEGFLEALPRGPRRALGGCAPMRAFLGVRVAAVK
jgi:SAM-dependent methyltransferase